MDNNRKQADLLVQRDDGWKTVHRLGGNDYVLIGTSSTCGLTLSGNRVSPIHCAIRAEQGEYWLEDWASDDGVFLRGEKLLSASRVICGDDIRVGEYRLELRMLDKPPAEADRRPASQAKPSSEAVSSPASDARPPGRTVPSSDGGQTRKPEASSPPLSTFPASASGRSRETTADRGTVAAISSLCDTALAPSEDLDDTDVQERLLAQQETMELLRAEIEQLQFDLAERDAHLSELTALDPQDPDDCEEVGEELVARVEELLVELQQSDERIALLDRLLQASEEAHRARREEQQHLEQWVNDIESRVSEREAEWKASIESLNHRLATVAQERDRLAAALAQTDTADVAVTTHSESPASDKRVSKSQLESEFLQQQLQDSQERCLQLEEQLKKKDQQLALETDGTNQVRQDQLALAQERAALARQRAEITTLQSEVENSRRGSSEIDERVREFRRHLREIHDEEQHQSGPGTLGARLSKLWARLDGR